VSCLANPTVEHERDERIERIEGGVVATEEVIDHDEREVLE